VKLNLNAKDLFAGAFLILVALAGLYLNQDHSLGTARRMGPGYMPMMVFWLLAGLGAFVVVAGLINGPDPLEKWTGVDVGSLAASVAAGVIAWKIAPQISSFFGQTYNGVGFGIMVGMIVLSFSAGWRMLGLICAAVAIFGLLLEKFGFFAALTGTILISAVAEPDHLKKPLGIAGIWAFLLVLCYWVFIYELDIRVNLWPQL
jgi:hypothetical protein